MPTVTNKQRVISQIFAGLHKGHKGHGAAAEPGARPVLEQFLYALCREGVTREKADQAGDGSPGAARPQMISVEVEERRCRVHAPSFARQPPDREALPGTGRVRPRRPAPGWCRVGTLIVSTAGRNWG